MFKIKIIHHPIGILNDVVVRSIETQNEYILKHIKDRDYKAYSIFDPNIDINDNRGTWKEIDIIKNFEKGVWVKT